MRHLWAPGEQPAASAAGGPTGGLSHARTPALGPAAPVPEGLAAHLRPEELREKAQEITCSFFILKTQIMMVGRLENTEKQNNNNFKIKIAHNPPSRANNC